MGGCYYVCFLPDWNCSVCVLYLKLWLCVCVCESMRLLEAIKKLFFFANVEQKIDCEKVIIFGGHETAKELD